MAMLGKWRLHWRQSFLVTAPFLPWASYVAHLGQISATLATQSQDGPSAQAAIVLLPVGLVCLWVVGRETAAWMAVPALWPSQQWYYATFVLPTRSRLSRSSSRRRSPCQGSPRSRPWPA
jgi:hypothetical protein